MGPRGRRPFQTFFKLFWAFGPGGPERLLLLAGGFAAHGVRGESSSKWTSGQSTVGGPKWTKIGLFISGLQKGSAERGHVKKRQKSSKSVKKFFDTFRQFSRRAKNVKNRQKVSKSFSTLFDNFRAAPFFRPLLQSADFRPKWTKMDHFGPFWSCEYQNPVRNTVGTKIIADPEKSF